MLYTNSYYKVPKYLLGLFPGTLAEYETIKIDPILV